MKIITETTLFDFNAWSGAISTKNYIIEQGKVEEFDELIEENYPNGLSDTELNDLLWFDSEWIYEMLGIIEEEEEEEFTQEEIDEYLESLSDYQSI